jgi:hypothetical protein
MRHFVYFCIPLSVFLPAITVNAATYGGGTGEPNNPWQIWTAAQMNTIGDNPADWTGSFILMADVNMAAYTGTQYNIIGDLWPPNDPNATFTGTFDGNGHVIGNLTIARSGWDYVGLFGYIGATGQVRNIAIADADILGTRYVGGLVGANYGTIRSCSVTGSVTGSLSVGGLAGCTDNVITDCHSAANVAAGSYMGWALVGGLVGANDVHGIVTSCSASGNVTATASAAGGFAGGNKGVIVRSCATGSVDQTNPWEMTGGAGGFTGNNDPCGTVSNCYATGNVTSTRMHVGGFVGYNGGIITSSYSTGSVTGAMFVGGLSGANGGTIDASFWDTQTSGMPTSNGGTPKNTAEMKTLSTFTSVGWDFLGETANGTADIWRMCASGVDYPHLTWEYVMAGDFACPDGVAFDDLALLINDWLLTYTTPFYRADATGDSSVNFLDYAILLANWTQGP